MRKLYFFLFLITYITLGALNSKLFATDRAYVRVLAAHERNTSFGSSIPAASVPQSDGRTNALFSWIGWLLCVILTLAVLVLFSDRKRIIASRNLEIASKSQELQVIQNQINQTNEELLAINANLEGLVEERTLKLSKVNRELDMFLYRSSHDLRRPVTTLMGLVEVSKLGFDEKTAQYLFSKINDTAVHMDTMLEKFFMINTINHESTEIGQVDFEEILDQINHSNMVSNYAQQVHFNSLIESGIEFISDYQLITFILKNLIDNAIVFRCKDGSRQPIVRVEVRPIGQAVTINVQDNGIGIPEAYLSEIFTIFYRGSEASKGNGLGLYVVRKAIEKLQGSINVTSQNGQFTCFHITLPHLGVPQLHAIPEKKGIRVSA